MYSPQGMPRQKPDGLPWGLRHSTALRSSAFHTPRPALGQGVAETQHYQGFQVWEPMAGRLRITDEFTEKLMGKGFSVSLPLEEAAIVEKEANRLGLPAASIIRLMMRDGQQRRELERQVDDLKARMELLQVQFQGLQILLETIALEQANARGPQALENRKALIQEIRKRQGLVEG